MLGNMVRRVTLGVTSGARWAFQGYEFEDDDTGSTISEGDDDEPTDVFQGIGIYARPATGDNSEAIMLHVGGEAEHPVLVGFRNEDARARYVAEFEDVAPGEIVIFHSAGTARVKITAAGEIEITATAGEKIKLKTKAGTSLPLATKADVLAVQAALNGHAHTYIPGPGPGVTQTTLNPSVPAPTGTTVVEGE